MKKQDYLFLCLLLFFACETVEQKQTALKDLQVIGSHNSYKLKMDPAIWQGLFQEDSIQAMQLDYGHISLTEQLDLGLRSLEIDVYHDPEGGRFEHPFGLTMMKMQGLNPAPFDTSIMEKPGLKVLHNHDFDFRSNCGTFRLCLEELKAWSVKNPKHLPIMITLNAKYEFIDRPGFTKPLPFSKNALDTIDQEILEIFQTTQLIRPDDIRGEAESLEAVILKDGWGSLEAAKGKFLFVLDHDNEILDRYIEGHAALRDRVMFVNAPVGTPEAAFLILNEVLEDFDLIQQRVQEGYLVRTRADAGTWEARRNDVSRFERAMASGAQVISTDYYLPDTTLGNTYQVRFPEGQGYHLLKEE